MGYCTISDDNKNLMTYKHIKKLCSDNNLYDTDELNEVLYLHMKGFHNIDGLSTFKNLKCLFLNNNCIKKIENLNDLVNLKALYLQNNDISVIENIDCMSLVILNLSNNKIKKIGNLHHLKFLQTLNVSNNLIEDIEDIKEVARLENLSHLDLSHNNINFEKENEVKNLPDCVRNFPDICSEKKSNLNEMENEQIQTCSMKENNNETIMDYFHFYVNFHEEITKNENPNIIKYHQNIQNMDQLAKKKFFFICEFIILLKKIKNLKTLFIKHNPFINKFKYTTKYLIANIPNIVFLDDKKIKKEDICLARIFLKKGAVEESELKKLFEQKKIDKYKNLTEKFHNFLLKKSESIENQNSGPIIID
ncbi:leucine-rich repeat protein [Plasmodium chabaudi chabaudi]|uniref:Leucine-rich repeat protein n=1 Tax=Plasmodium chabaudi chabaudi TaxID=31271 RepID=A0A4V0K8G7_PLACU|nr:leucine-rich repeat protein [Plasmodium chabaudi chabaudi]VTZ69081.1 leucine-rich repeat protein [Plasmodium chabaudi chabaudi]|eukprot:XP_016653931.1 leucine-rich repeat protein [Plasmodium chabaudi chabaudi]